MVTKRYHYIFDTSNVPEEFVNNKESVEQVLHELPPMVGMTIIKGPIVVDGTAVNPGISGFCIIDYSHISIHTFSNPKEMLVDIFSCKPYNPEIVKDYLLNFFHLDPANIHFFQVKYD